MSVRLPSISGQAAIRAFKKTGFVPHRIKGSHHILFSEERSLVLVVPVHSRKDLAKGTLRSLIKAAGLTVEEFVELLD